MEDRLSEKLSKAESNLSFHAMPLLNETQEAIPGVSKINPNVLCGIYVVCQVFQLMIGYSLIQEIDAITIATQRCIVKVIITLMYIQIFDKRLFVLDTNCIRVIGAMAACQVIASLVGFWAMTYFPFSEICAFHQLTPAYIQVFNHFMFQAGSQLPLLICLTQTLSTLLFGANLLYVFVCLLQPVGLGFADTLKGMMSKQLPFFTQMLYQSLFGLPVYFIINVMAQEVQNSFSGTYFLEITFMTILQMIAYIAQNELQQLKTIKMWILPGIVTILSMFVQLGFHQVGLNYGTLSIIFIVFTSIHYDKK